MKRVLLSALLAVGVLGVGAASAASEIARSAYKCVDANAAANEALKVAYNDNITVDVPPVNKNEKLAMHLVKISAGNYCYLNSPFFSNDKVSAWLNSHSKVVTLEKYGHNRVGLKISE